MNSEANALIGAATAKIASHRIIDVLIAGVCVRGKKRRSRHDLPSLTVAALWYIIVNPRLLHRMQFAVLSEAFDGCNSQAGCRTYWKLT